MKHKHIANYCRVSTREQAEFGFSLIDQQKKNEFWLDMFPEEYPKETTTIKNYIDEGESASNLNRTAMKELIFDIKRGKINVVIVHNLDRLTRRLKDLIFMIELFEEYDVSLVSIKEKIETETAMGRFFMMIIILIAQWELETISERTKRGLDRSALEGNYTKSYPPLGYNKVNKRLEVNETEAEIVRLIFKMYLVDHHSLFAISTYLNSVTALDIVWTYNRISNILQNPIYIGEYSNHRISIPEHSPAIVEESQFLLARERLKLKNIAVEHKYIFKGIVRDSKNRLICDHSSTIKPTKTYLYYLEAGTNKRINEARILKQIELPINKYIQNEIKRHLRRNAKYTGNKKQLIEQINLLYDIGLLEDDFRDERINEIENEIEDLKTSLFKVIKGLRKWTVMSVDERVAFATKHIKSIIVNFDTKLVDDINFYEPQTTRGLHLRKREASNIFS